MYVKTVGPPLADIMLVGEAPGREEDRIGKPFQGAAGNQLNRGLVAAGIDRNECLIANVARERPPKNDIGFYFYDKKHTQPKERMQEWIKTLEQEIKMYRPNIVVALGDTAMWALTGLHGITKFRGYVTESTLVRRVKVLPTFHPANVMRVPKNFLPFVMDLRKALYHSAFPEIKEDKSTLVIDPDKDFFISYCEDLIKRNKIIAVDIESTRSHVNRIGIARNENFAVTLGILKGEYTCFPERDEIEIWRALSRLLEKVPQIYHNGSYDIAVLWYRNHFKCNLVHDTMIAGHVTFPECPKSLGFLASMLLDVQAWKHTADEDAPRYNALDALNTYRLFKWFEKHNCFNDTYKREISWIPTAVKLQLQGLKVDLEKRDSLMKEAKKIVKATEEEIQNVLGYPLNCNSPKQVQKCLYIDLGLPLQYKRRKSVKEARRLTSDDKALQKLAHLHPVPSLIIKERKAKKLISNFLDISVSPEGKVHTCYNVTGTELGGRWSSSKSIILPYGPGNLQNIPEAMRQIYTIPKGYVLVEGDYIQAEAVVVAYDSQDLALIRFFEEAFGMPPFIRKKSHDLHRYTASIMYDIPMDEVTSEQRKIGKRLRHAGNYGAGPDVVAAALDTTRAVAKKHIEIYYNVNPMLKAWQNNIRTELNKTRTLYNLYGRKHVFHDHFPGVYRAGFSFIPQSTVGEMLNNAMVKFDNKYGSEFNIILQLHDAFYVLAEEGKERECIEKMRECMLTPLKVHGRTMIVDVDFSISKCSWGDMEPVEIDWRK